MQRNFANNTMISRRIYCRYFLANRSMNLANDPGYLTVRICGDSCPSIMFTQIAIKSKIFSKQNEIRTIGRYFEVLSKDFITLSPVRCRNELQSKKLIRMEFLITLHVLNCKQSAQN